jgi:molybdate transport system substrate-binding protein
LNRIVSLVLAASAIPHASHSPSLTVFAAASLSGTFREIGHLYQARHPGTIVTLNFAGSQQLAVQIEQGARADVFASADARWMQYLQGRGLLEGEPRVLARNRLVVILPAGNPAHIERLGDLAHPGLKIILAAEAVPAGAYSREVLRRLSATPGFGADYAARVLANVVSLEEDVNAVAGKVRLGEADAGIVYRTDAGSGTNGLRVLEIPDSANAVAEYLVGTVRSSRSAEAAGMFIALVLSPDGQKILRDHGFLPAEAP